MMIVPLVLTNITSGIKNVNKLFEKLFSESNAIKYFKCILTTTEVQQIEEIN
jgi:Na+/H+-dicarboxylate symporter